MKHCSLLGAAIAFVFAGETAAMTVSVEGSTMTLSGLVDPQTVNMIITRLRAQPRITTVVLRQSGGGAAGSMIAIAQEFRERGVTTMVNGRCVSACAVMFMGGVQRTIAPGARPNATFVAFHGVHAAGNPSLEWAQTLSNALVRLSGGRLGHSLAREMVGLPSNGFAAFYHPRHYQRADGASVAWCRGPERVKTRDCESRRGVDGLSAGVFTR